MIEVWPLERVLNEVWPTTVRKGTPRESWERHFVSLEGKPWRYNGSVCLIGVKNPVKIWKSNVGLHLTDGHHRIWASKQIGVQEIMVELS